MDAPASAAVAQPQTRPQRKSRRRKRGRRDPVSARGVQIRAWMILLKRQAHQFEFLADLGLPPQDLVGSEGYSLGLRDIATLLINKGKQPPQEAIDVANTELQREGVRLRVAYAEISSEAMLIISSADEDVAGDGGDVWYNEISEIIGDGDSDDEISDAETPMDRRNPRVRSESLSLLPAEVQFKIKLKKDDDLEIAAVYKKLNVSMKNQLSRRSKKTLRVKVCKLRSA